MKSMMKRKTMMVLVLVAAMLMSLFPATGSAETGTAEVNLALGRPASASAESYGRTYPATGATDGVYQEGAMDFNKEFTPEGQRGNTWITLSPNPEWWQVDLQCVAEIAEVKVQYWLIEGKYADENRTDVTCLRAPKTVTFQVSEDGQEWTDVISKSSNVPVDKAENVDYWYTYNFQGVRGRYVRLLFEDGNTLDGYAISEVQVYGNVAEIVNIAEGKPASASHASYGEEWPPVGAVDGVYQTEGNYNGDIEFSGRNTWATVSSDPQWWQVDLQCIAEVSQIKVQYWIIEAKYVDASRSDYTCLRVPRTITFQISQDGQSWTDIIGKSANVPVEKGTTDYFYTYDLSGARGRYLRLAFEDGPQGDGYALNEVQVYGEFKEPVDIKYPDDPAEPPPDNRPPCPAADVPYINTWLVAGPFGETLDPNNPPPQSDPIIRVLNDNDPEIIYNGSWEYISGRGIGDFEDDLHQTSVDGDFFEFTFTGVKVSLRGELGPEASEFDVYIDGTFDNNVNPVFGNTIYTNEGLYDKNLPYGTYTIKCVKKNGEYMRIDQISYTTYDNPPPKEPGTDFDTDFIGEAAVRPVEGTQSGDKEWKYFDDRLFSRNLDDFQDLYSYFKVKQDMETKYKVAYAHTYVYSPEESQAQLSVGANDAFKAWINGELVASTNKEDIARRDESRVPVTLKQGWNSLLIRLANHDAAWGFYARIADMEGNLIPGLQFSVNGGEGALEISTKGLEFSENNMPDGYRDWPYVWIRLDKGGVDNASASRFRFNARGGAAPYQWSITEGLLPDGLTLDPLTGELDGKTLATGKYTFTVQVTDSAGNTASKELTITVRERPTRWIEEDKLGGLWHSPAMINNPPAGFELDSYMAMLEKIGYRYIAPTTGGGVDDYPAAYPYLEAMKTAAEAHGIKFGIYFSTRDHKSSDGTRKNVFNRLENIQVNYQPVIFWFDEFKLSSQEAERDFEFDAFFSMLKSYNPDVLILINGEGISEDISDTYNRGDVDLLSAEGWASDEGWYWDRWPRQSYLDKNPKKIPYESWRYPNPASWSLSGGVNNLDPKEWLKVMLSLIGEGYVANLDVTIFTGEDYNTKIAMQQYMADWINPRPGVSMTEALRNTVPGPLKEEDWGYSVSSKDNIYLYILSNPRGKTGLPEGDTLTVGPVDDTVINVSVLNTGEELDFQQNAGELTISASNLAQDPVCTMLKITTVATSISSARKLMDHYQASGELKGELVAQLTNNLNQAEHQLEKGCEDEAMKHVELFLVHLCNKNRDDDISVEAKEALSLVINRLISTGIQP